MVSVFHYILVNFAKTKNKMKKLIILLFMLMAMGSIQSQTKLYLTANGVTKTATLVQNEATGKLLSLLEKGPLTLSMTENGGFEKIGNLPESLPTSDVRQTAQAGDIMLYIGDVLCIFYGANTWAYTKLGTLDNMSSAEIKEFLKGNPVNVSLSIEEDAGIEEINVSDIKTEKVYDLKGNLIINRPLVAGVYIINGKKTIVK